jgi:peptidoglycan/LPS O-acetylase OafA/YrhL
MLIAPGQPRAARLPSLTGLRFIAAMLVFALHATFQTSYIGGPFGHALGEIFARSGYYAVSFFFVLSGFVLTWSTRPGDRTTSIWRRRLVKIYPNHVVTFGLAAVLIFLTSGSFTLKGTLANLFLVQAWIPDIPTSRSMNQVSWSLSCELFFYLIFPLLLRLLNRVPVGRLWALAGVLVALMVSVPLVSRAAIGGVPLPSFADGSLSFEQIWFVYLFPAVRALEFVLGMVVARLVMTGALPRIRLLPACLIAVGGYAVTLKVPYLFGIAGSSAAWLAPLVVAAASADISGTASPFRGRILVWLGDRSFALYMVHGMVVAYSYRWFVAGHDRPLAAEIGILIAVLALCLTLSHALFTWVEQPLVRRFSHPAPIPPARRLITQQPNK